MRARAGTLVAVALSVAVAGSLVMGVTASAKTGGRAPASARSAKAGSDATLQPSAALTIDLCAKTGDIDLPGAPSVPIWGFASDDDDDGCADEEAQLPGPVLGVDTPPITAGDTLTINLTNVDVPENVSVLIPGIPGDELMPDTEGVAANDDTTYGPFVVSAPGTYIYETGAQSPEGPTSAKRETGIPMGLYGALIVRSTIPGRAYDNPSSAYDDEQVLVLSEIDPALNEDPDGSDCAPQHPPNCHLLDYSPKYWLINGEAYPDTDPIPAASGERLLLRYVNAGAITDGMALLGAHQRVVAKDAFAGYPYRVAAETIAAGSTMDAIATPCVLGGDTELPLYNSNLRLSNGDFSPGLLHAPGGMMTFVNLTGSGCPPATNIAPTVDAGANQSVNPPTAVLDGTVNDDFVTAVSTLWTKISGPGAVTFGDATDVDTTASFTAAGDYVLRLTADDGVNAPASDSVTISVLNPPPTVNAGSDQTITFPLVGPASTSLDGSVTDDGFTLVTKAWSKTSGPGTVIFGSPTAEDTTATFSLPGTYVLRLTANDGVNSPVFDEVTITVNPTPIHVGDLDGSRANIGGNRWRAFVTITVHSGTHALASGALVSGTWSAGDTSGQTLSCTTNGSGTCTVQSGRIPRTTATVTFTVGSVTRANSAYVPGANHDPDAGDQASNGTVKMVRRP